MSVTRTPRLDAIRRREQIAHAERERLFRHVICGLLMLGALFLFLAVVKS